MATYQELVEKYEGALHPWKQSNYVGRLAQNFNQGACHGLCMTFLMIRYSWGDFQQFMDGQQSIDVVQRMHQAELFGTTRNQRMNLTRQMLSGYGLKFDKFTNIPYPYGSLMTYLQKEEQGYYLLSFPQHTTAICWGTSSYSGADQLEFFDPNQGIAVFDGPNKLNDFWDFLRAFFVNDTVMGQYGFVSGSTDTSSKRQAMMTIQATPLQIEKFT